MNRSTTPCGSPTPFPRKWHTAKEQITEMARGLLDSKLALLTEEHRARFALCFPSGIPTLEKVIEAMDLVNRTLDVQAQRHEQEANNG